MKDLQPRQLYWSLLNKKGTVIDIDIIVAYLLFITIIVLMINYSLRLTAPFTTNIESIDKEKSTLTIEGLIDTSFGINEFDELCDFNYVGVRRFSVSYEIKGFEMPHIDVNNISPASINGSVIFKRDGDTLHVYTGSQHETKSVSVEVYTREEATATNNSLEPSDSLAVYYDQFDNLVIAFDSVVSEGDVDEVIIKPLKGIVSFNVNGVNKTSIFIGNLSASDYCGTRGIIGTRTSFNRYGLINDGQTNYYAKIMGDLWWTS